MLYLIKWIVFYVLVLSSFGCSTMGLVGPAPKVDLCSLYAFENPNKTWTVQARCKNQKGVKFDLPVSKLDKYMCVHPDQFVDTIIYFNKLISAIKTEYDK